ncbi:hypothetical protein M0Y02_23135, partial [Salmonella enterica]|nr:hypothetical protein [Salmonella enterica]
MGKREISSVFTAFFAQKNFFSSPPLKGQNPIPISLVTSRETVYGPASPITDNDFLKGELSMS